ncbi:unnamed protein product [Mucor hiemalis]
MVYMEKIDNFAQYQRHLDYLVSQTINAMDNLQHTIIPTTRTAVTTLEKMKFLHSAID